MLTRMLINVGLLNPDGSPAIGPEAGEPAMAAETPEPGGLWTPDSDQPAPAAENCGRRNSNAHRAGVSDDYGKTAICLLTLAAKRPRLLVASSPRRTCRKASCGVIFFLAICGWTAMGKTGQVQTAIIFHLGNWAYLRLIFQKKPSGAGISQKWYLYRAAARSRYPGSP